MAADTPPLFSAVKNDDAKIFTPANTKENENIRKACFVISNSSASYPTNTWESGPASTHAAAVMIIPATLTAVRLFFSRFFSSS